MNYEITMLKDGHPTARKEHKCMFCGRIIRKGEKYMKLKLDSIKNYRL